MKFDVIITTYNRPDSVLTLVEQINRCTLLPRRIVVVDSSDTLNLEIRQIQSVLYLHSSHKNQPYQRYLGFLVSQEEIVCFFDDDIQIINPAIFEVMLYKYLDKETVGCNVKYINEGEITVQRELNHGNHILSKSKAGRLILFLTGVPHLEEGKAWLAGMRGEDGSNSFTETFSGPGGLSFRRQIVPSLFDDVLFALFEKKMAMGEDKYISLGALRFGKLAHVNDPCLLHSENTSNYFQDQSSFVRKELYSRLWLSRRYLHVKKKWVGWGYLHFYWFALWRILIAGIHCLVIPPKGNFQIFRGKLVGVTDTVLKPFRAESLCPDINWADEFAKDLKN